MPVREQRERPRFRYFRRPGGRLFFNVKIARGDDSDCTAAVLNDPICTMSLPFWPGQALHLRLRKLGEDGGMQLDGPSPFAGLEETVRPSYDLEVNHLARPGIDCDGVLAGIARGPAVERYFYLDLLLKTLEKGTPEHQEARALVDEAKRVRGAQAFARRERKDRGGKQGAYEKPTPPDLGRMAAWCEVLQREDPVRYREVWYCVGKRPSPRETQSAWLPSLPEPDTLAEMLVLRDEERGPRSDYDGLLAKQDALGKKRPAGGWASSHDRFLAAAPQHSFSM